MDGSTAAWFALIGFLGLPVIQLFDEHKKAQKGSKKAKAFVVLSIIGAFCCLVMVLQGIHLWGTWEAPIFDSNDAARISSKARGRGGIILLIATVFPQFLVFGFGIWGLMYIIPLRMYL